MLTHYTYPSQYIASRLVSGQKARAILHAMCIGIDVALPSKGQDTVILRSKGIEVSLTSYPGQGYRFIERFVTF